MLGKMMRVCGCVDCVDCVCGFCFFVEDGFVLENFIDWVNVWLVKFSVFDDKVFRSELFISCWLELMLDLIKFNIKKKCRFKISGKSDGYLSVLFSISNCYLEKD